MQLNNTCPNSLTDCLQPDPAAAELLTTAHTLQRWAMGVFKFFCALSAIAVIIMIGTLIVEESSEAEAVSLGCFITAISAIATGLVDYFILHLISQHYLGLANTVQNTKMSAMVAIYQASKEEPIDEKQVVLFGYNDNIAQPQKVEPKKSFSWKEDGDAVKGALFIGVIAAAVIALIMYVMYDVI